MSRVYEEIVDFIAAGHPPGAIAAWTPSPEALERVATLLQRSETGSISADERAELNHYLELEHLMRLAKARARRFASDD